MKNIFFICAVLFSTLAMGQGVSNFGAGRPQDTSKTKGQIVATAYANSNTAMFATFNSSGHLVLAVPAGGGGSADSSIFVTITRLRDSLLLKLSVADSGVYYVTPQDLADAIAAIPNVDTNGLSIRINYNLSRILALSDSMDNVYDSLQVHYGLIAQNATAIATKANQSALEDTAADHWAAIQQNKSNIAYNLTRIDGLSDTALLHADSLEAHKAWLSSIEGQIAAIPTDTIPTWQAVLNEGRTGDSVLISNKLFVGTTEDYKPISIQVIGDSRDAAVFGGIAPLKIWPQRVANLMGANLNQALAQPSTFFMNEEPRFNPLDDTSAVMDVILTDKIKNVTGLSDSDYYLFVTRCINDLHWYTTEDSGYNYTPENFGRDYRIFMDTIVNRGYDMDKVVLMGPKYVLPTSTMVIQDSVYRWIDTVRQIASDYGCKFFDAFHWEEGRGGASLLDIDDFHENETGHAVLTKGMIVTIAAPVKRNGQTLAVNGIFETNRMIFRGGNDSSTANSWVMMVNANGEVFTSGNKVIWNNPIDSGRQEADINVAKMKARSLDLTGINSVSLKIGNNTAIQGAAASGGVVYIDASANTTGTVNVRAGSTTTFNSTEVSSTVPFRSSLMWVGVAVQGNSASNGTLYLDASKNTTGTVNIRAGSTTTFNSSGITATAITQTGAHTINNNWQVGTDGKLKEYGNATPANGQVLIGDGTDMELATLTAGSHISVTNGAGSITIAATGFVDSVTKSNDSFFYYKGATRYFIGTDNSGSGSGIDSVRISGDTLYQCSSGTCTFVGLVNTGGGGSGTVTSVTATDGNGFDFTVANTTTTPVISATLQSDYNFVTDAEKAAIGSLATDYVSLAGSYSNPTWITALAWSKITGTPTTLAGYSISDAQPLDADLTAIAGLSPTNDDILQRKAGSWINRTMAQLKTDLALTKSDVGLSSVDNTADASKNVATAATLTTARNIDNTSFNGSAPIVLPRVWQGKLAGETDTLTTGVKLTFRMPYACTITGVKAAVNTASSSGNITIDIHENGTTIMSTTKITINATETSSLAVGTTQPVLTDTSIAADALIQVEVDAAGTNAISGEVTIYYTLQ